MTIQITHAAEKDAEILAQPGAETFTAAFGHLYTPKDLDTFLREAHNAQAYEALISSSSHSVWKTATKTGDAVGYGVAGPMGLPAKNAADGALELKRFYVESGFYPKVLEIAL